MILNFLLNTDKTNFIYILDKYTNYVCISISNSVNKHINNLLTLNNVIINFCNSNTVNYLNLNNIKFNKFINTFITILVKLIKFITNYYKVSLKLVKIYHKIIIINNKLIIKLENCKSFIIYIPDINTIKINLKQNGNLIEFYSFNIDLINNITSIIQNYNKINTYTGKGIYYLNKSVILKTKK